MFSTHHGLFSLLSTRPVLIYLHASFNLFTYFLLFVCLITFFYFFIGNSSSKLDFDSLMIPNAFIQRYYTEQNYMILLLSDKGFVVRNIIKHGPPEGSQGLLTKINHPTYMGYKGLNFFLTKLQFTSWQTFSRKSPNALHCHNANLRPASHYEIDCKE